MQRKSTILTVALVLGHALVASAFFSQHVVVRPGGEGDHKILVESVRDDDAWRFRIRGSIKDAAWLVRTDAPLSDDALDLRSVVWERGERPEWVQRATRLKATVDTTSLPEVLTFRIADALVRRTYLVLDAATPVEDGGFYYTVVLGDFISP